MRKDTNLIIINGVSIPAPDEGFSIQEITNVDAGRNSNGTVVGQRVGRNIWKIRKKYLPLQSERNLFRVRAPVGPASDLLK